MNKPLTLERVAMVGHDGTRNNVQRLLEMTQGLMARGMILRCNVAHDAGCPCLNGAGMPDCICDYVDLTLWCEP